jgi:protein-S-isoprenylcysteine O-methyltransferase Ste14
VDTARYFAGVLVVTFLPPGLLWWFLVHPFVRIWRRVGPRVTLVTMSVLGVGGVAVLLRFRAVLVGRDLGPNTGLIALGAVTMVASWWIALLRRRYLTSSILAGVPELEEGGAGGRLLTEGIYARMRHPRYVEVALGTLAWACFANFVGAWIVALGSIPVLHLIVLIEERELADRFGGEYQAYRASVPRYLPRRS